MSVQDDDILGPKEVAQILRLTDRTVKKMANEGELTGFRISKRWRFRRASIDAYVRQRERDEISRKVGVKDERSTIQ